MKRIKPTSILLIICILLSVGVFSACGISEEEKTAREIMLGKYRISEPEKADEEFRWIFERRLYRLTSSMLNDTGSFGYHPEITSYFPEITSEEVAQRFISEAEAANVPLIQYVSDVGVRLPYCHGENSCNDPYDPDYYIQYTDAVRDREAAMRYLSDLWNLEVEPGGSAEDAVMEYCRENSKITYGYPDPERLVRRAGRRLYTRPSRAQTLYVIGEGGYAAVYERDSGIYYGYELEAANGDRIFGATNMFTVSRFCGSENWEYIISADNYHSTVLKFDRWVTADSEDYDAFVAIYGTEPKLHP